VNATKSIDPQTIGLDELFDLSSLYNPKTSNIVFPIVSNTLSCPINSFNYILKLL